MGWDSMLIGNILEVPCSAGSCIYKITGGIALKSPGLSSFLSFLFLGLLVRKPLTLFTGQLITWLAELEGRGLYAASIRGSKVICNLSKLICSIQYRLKKKMLVFVK